jgi:hypothetical protein
MNKPCGPAAATIREEYRVDVGLVFGKLERVTAANPCELNRSTSICVGGNKYFKWGRQPDD